MYFLLGQTQNIVFCSLDQDTELKLAHVKLKDLESALQKQKDEVNIFCLKIAK